MRIRPTCAATTSSATSEKDRLLKNWTVGRNHPLYKFVAHEIVTVFQDGLTGVTWRWGTFNVTTPPSDMFKLSAGNWRERPTFLSVWYGDGLSLHCREKVSCLWSNNLCLGRQNGFVEQWWHFGCFHVFSLPAPWRRRMILSEPMCRPVNKSTDSRGVGHGCGGNAPRDRPSNVRLRPERWKAAYPGCVTWSSRPGLWLPDWERWKAAYPGDVTLTSRPGLGLPGEWRPAASAVWGQIGGGGRQLIQAA